MKLFLLGKIRLSISGKYMQISLSELWFDFSLPGDRFIGDFFAPKTARSCLVDSLKELELTPI
jgi:hypothetical protein